MAAVALPYAIDFSKKIFLMPRGVKEIPGQKPTRNIIIMVICARPKIVTLPNGRRFTARFKRATCNNLPADINFPRVYKQRAVPKGKRRRRAGQQRGRGFKSAASKVLKIAKKIAKNKAFRNIAKTAIAEVPGAVGKLSSKVKNKKLKAILDNDITKTGLDLAAGYAMDKLS